MSRGWVPPLVVMAILTACAGGRGPEPTAGKPMDLDALCSRFADETVMTAAGPVRCRVLWPEETDADARVPLVVYLHGAGERGADNRRQLTHLVGIFAEKDARREHPCIVLAPQCRPHPERWVDTPWFKTTHTLPAEPTASLGDVLALLDHALERWPVDPDRVYAVGMSMGGYGAWDLLMRRPATFAAAIILCGGADPERLAAVAHVPAWLLHGAEDTVVPTCRTADAARLLTAAGATPRVTWYEGRGHDIWAAAAAEPDLVPWLFAHRRPGAGAIPETRP